MSSTSRPNVNFVDLNPPPKGAIIALGVFDGVHLGHQELMQAAMRTAHECSPTHCPTGAVSFWPHPQLVFLPDFPLLQLTNPNEQESISKQLGLDYFGFFHFTHAFASLTPMDFAQKILVEQLAVKGVVVGFNFHYGARNQGDSRTLHLAGQSLGFRVMVVDPVIKHGDVISSTRIRALLTAGEVAAAAELLGRPYFLSGVVSHGFGRGKGLGFPTANLKLPSGRLIPAPGVYAGSAVLPSGARHLAAIFIGSRLTFGEESQSVEVFILDWDGQLYEQQLRIEFTQWLRGITKFGSTAELSAQVHQDVCQIRQLAYK